MKTSPTVDARFIRRLRFQPYLQGPTFTLAVWELSERGEYGRWRVGYVLRQHQRGTMTKVLFEGTDYSHAHPTPLENGAIVDLVGFLTLKPGDTDQEYFDAYSAIQFEFCAKHAEALEYDVDTRFEEAR